MLYYKHLVDFVLEFRQFLSVCVFLMSVILDQLVSLRQPLCLMTVIHDQSVFVRQPVCLRSVIRDQAGDMLSIACKIWGLYN